MNCMFPDDEDEIDPDSLPGGPDHEHRLVYDTFDVVYQEEIWRCDVDGCIYDTVAVC